jgi:integrase
MLTGQRVRECGDLVWGEIDLERRMWTLPKERAKNGRAHDVYLSDLTLETIGKLPRFAGDKDFIFSRDGRKPVTSYSDAKLRIDKLLAELVPNMQPWVLHDIRRSVATKMADSECGLAIAPHVLDRILNHVSGAGGIVGVAAVYNRNQYAPERREALQAWGRYLEGLIYPERAQQNVVAMRGR